MNEDGFVNLMTTAITDSDGTEDEALTMFEMQVLDRGSPRLVWDLFERVRLTTLRRLYRMAKYQIEQAASEAQPNAIDQPNVEAGTVSEPDGTADSSALDQSTQTRTQHSAVSPEPQARKVTSFRSRSPRSASSAQGVIMDIGGRQAQYDRLTDHYGHPLSGMTAGGLSNFHDENPRVMRYAQLLWDAIPKSGRAGDIVRKFITPDEADKMWLDMLKEVA